MKLFRTYVKAVNDSTPIRGIITCMSFDRLTRAAPWFGFLRPAFLPEVHVRSLAGTMLGVEIKKDAQRPSLGVFNFYAVEHRRIELLTFCLQSRCSTN